MQITSGIVQLIKYTDEYNFKKNVAFACAAAGLPQETHLSQADRAKASKIEKNSLTLWPRQAKDDLTATADPTLP